MTTTVKFTVKGIENVDALLQEAIIKSDALRTAAAEFADVLNRINKVKFEIEEETSG